MVAHTLAFADRLSCDLCGEDHVELRTYPMHGWTADDVLCAACFVGRDGENSFTDFPLAQAADSLERIATATDQETFTAMQAEQLHGL